MAKDKKAKKDKGAKESKEWRKARARWQALEDEVGKEFGSLVEDGYDILELETLRWDYRYDKTDQYKLTKAQIEYFVAEADAKAANEPAPPKPGEPSAAAQAAGASASASPQGGEYQRKSEVDPELIEKYLEKRITRVARNDFAAAYKEAFGEDLHVPDNLDLVEMSYSTREIAAADRAVKLSKAEILGLPEEATAAQAAAPEAVAEVAPAVKRPSQAAAAVFAFRRGVPKGPTRDEKWSAWNPFKFWLIPKRLAGASVGRYYVFLLVNLLIFVGQFVLLFIPFLIRLIVWGIGYIWKRLLKQRVAPALKSLKDKAAIPPQSAAEGKKEPSGTKSS